MKMLRSWLSDVQQEVSWEPFCEFLRGLEFFLNSRCIRNNKEVTTCTAVKRHLIYSFTLYILQCFCMIFFFNDASTLFGFEWINCWECWREEQQRNFYILHEFFGSDRPLGLQAEAEIAQGPISACYLCCLLLIGCRDRGLIKQKWGCGVNVHYN